MISRSLSKKEFEIISLKVALLVNAVTYSQRAIYISSY